MSDVEDRLRRDLPALADALTNTTANPGDGGERSMDEMSYDLPSTGRSRRGLGAFAVAACAAAALLAAVLITRDDPGPTAVDAVDRSLAPGGGGTWDVIPAAPIAAPAYPASIWTGTEAVFWAGSSLDRGFAYSDAAAFDPVDETWRSASAPGWGHPGLISVEVDGLLFATAKGSIGRLDVDTGEWVELPAFDQLEIRSIAPGDGGIWALGPRPEEPTRLGVAFFDASTERWDDGGDLGPDAAEPALEALTNLAQPVLWTGDAVVVWAQPRAFAYDTTEGRWAPLPPLPELDRDVVATRAVADGSGLVVLVESIRGGDHVVTALRWDGADRWSSLDDVELPVEDLDRTTVGIAGEWLMLLPPEGPPVSLHPASGTSHVHADAPIQGIEGPGTVWTGTELVVWGGVLAEGSDLPAGAGMIWTAPDGVTETEPSPSSPDPAPSTNPPPPDALAADADVSLWLSADRVPPGAIDVVGVLLNHTGIDVTFGVAAEVERWDGDEWLPHGGIAMCMDHWHCTAEVQPSIDGLAVRLIGLSPTLESPGPVERFTTAGLEPGWYRISQTSNDGTVASGVLQIAEDAEAPAPLVPVDDPAISIHPAVMSTAGATVTLHPLIPAPSGSQSITDVEAAIEELAETADLERWDGGEWVHVSVVSLEPPAPGESTVGRSAIIPEDLDPGAYRLVRAGPDGRHTGSFWVQR
jgi:hypothetical protein